MARSFYRDWYTPSTPIRVTGGIKAQNQKGSFAREWWGKRWIEVLEGFRIGARMERGRSYARKGQVVRLNIQKGVVRAAVQGSRAGEYNISIKISVFSDQQWDQVISGLMDHPAFVTSLLSGEMPREMEEQLNSVGLSLFPEKRKDLRTSCTCPDSSNPCKHIAAVFYIMAEAFDENPFFLFTLRGMDRDDFMARLQEGLPQTAPDEDRFPPEPLPEDAELFWKGVETGKGPVNFLEPLRVHGSLPARLGRLPFWRA
ncbi:MAG TPA: hypothetical protein ENN89_05825, partial [Synergistetes bacterium]|nr:hypothetical protein [Synergistota bacterium]